MLTDRAEKNYLREEVPFSFPLWKSDAKVRVFFLPTKQFSNFFQKNLKIVRFFI